MLGGTDIRASALRDAELRKRVVKHKDEFYPSGWGRYDLAVPGTFSLSPRTERIEELRRDYEGMRVMIFGQPPTFDEILESLKSLETEINQSPGVSVSACFTYTASLPLSYSEKYATILRSSLAIYAVRF